MVAERVWRSAAESVKAGAEEVGRLGEGGRGGEEGEEECGEERSGHLVRLLGCRWV